MHLGLACMTLGIYKTCFGVHDSWYWFGIFKGNKRFWWHFFGIIYHLGWLGKKAFGQSLVQEKFSLLLLHFDATKISKFVFQVSSVSSLDIWGFLWFVLGDLVFFFFFFVRYFPLVIYTLVCL